MFILDDWELPQERIDVLCDLAHVETDGYIWFPAEEGRRKAAPKGKYNVCQIYLAWETADAAGVQSIKVGHTHPLGRYQWRRRLNAPHKDSAGNWQERWLDHLIRERAQRIQDVFLEEPVECRFVGWCLSNAKFWTPPKGTFKARPARHKYKVIVGPRDSDPTMAS